ncbi:tyrosine-type recombinase/integrase [Craterilacuibacter sp.]|uniref:tyrosine-type recombinase/integrase n=1 Tax=Craterilacuibacter sp. TaxID=2870909 RepID=UPI003F2F6BC9
MLPTLLPPQNPKLLIRAHSDEHAVLAWLSEHADRPHTLAGYRKEAERFLLWLTARGQTLVQVKREDVHDYQHFLAQPGEDWIGPSRARKHPQWKPFAGPLSLSSIKHALTIIAALYRYLGDAGYLSGNPFALVKSRHNNRDNLPFERFLDERAWQAIMQALAQLPEDSAKDHAHAVRTRWLITLMYLTGARRSEVAHARMGDILLHRGRHWWRIQGKGGGLAEVPVSIELMKALAHYRQSLGLAAEVRSTEDTPLVCRLGSLKPLGDKAIYLICKEVFKRAEACCADETSRLSLRKASCHWLRHTSASHQLEAGVSLLMVSQNLRHASIQTTRRYLHSEHDARHEASTLHVFKAEKERKQG